VLREDNNTYSILAIPSKPAVSSIVLLPEKKTLNTSDTSLHHLIATRLALNYANNPM